MVKRLPRILWELSAVTIAKASSQTVSPPLCLMLFIMMITTSLVDIFIWTPVFAAFASFESCSGGGWFQNDQQVCHPDYVKGFGRLLFTVQSMLGGLIYLGTGGLLLGIATRYAETSRGLREKSIFGQMGKTKS